jgi:putative spermidine/putrescine transport system permease protein
MSSVNNWYGPRRAHYWLLIPALALIAFMLLAPLGMMFSNSVYEFDPFKGRLPTITFAHYAKFFEDTFLIGVLWRTIWISVASALVCLLIGYPVAYYYVFHAGASRPLIVLGLLSPLFVSTLVRNYGWLVMLGRGGPVEATLQWLGLIDGRLRVLQTEIGVIIGLVHLFLAFMVLSITAALRNIDPSVLRAAEVAGASPLRKFLRVTFPLSIPGVVSGSVVVFSLCAGAFITPAIMGGLRVRVMSIAIWEQVSVLHNYAFGSVLAIALMSVVVAAVFLSARLVKSGPR